MRLASLLLLLAPAVASAADPQAESIFLRSISRRFPVNIVALIAQRDPKNERSMQSIRVERDREGRTHHIVLGPLRMMGFEIADDGEMHRAYMPDTNTLIEEESGLRVADDASRRFQIARQNYSFKIKGREKVADRETIEVVASPKHGAMYSRRYFLDSQYYYPLRVVNVSPSGQETTMLDTLDIFFPNSIPMSRFDVSPPGTPRVMRYERQPRATPSMVESRLGFEPLLPSTLPLGFRQHPAEMKLTTDDKWKAVSVIVTDGIFRATIYQWKASPTDKMRVKSIENNSFRRHGDISVMLVSDLAPELRDLLLDGFVERAETEALFGQLDPFGTLQPPYDVNTDI